MKIVIEIPDHVYEHAKNGSEDSYDEWDAMRAIANGTPYEERPCGEWIPCSERLPEVGGHFLITNIDELVRLDYFRKSTNDFDNYSAIAWMPLPEPYKKEGEADG